MSSLFLAQQVVLLLAMEEPSVPNMGSGPSAPLKIVMHLEPQVAKPQESPTLTVEATNTSSQKLRFEDFSSAACFADMYLTMTLKLPAAGAEARKASCVVKVWPGNTKELAPGASVTKVLPLAELFPSVVWAEGRYQLEASWNPERLKAQAKERFRLDANMSMGGLETFRIAKVLAKVRAEKGKEIALPDGARFLMVGHSHKQTMAGGPRSPLMLFAKLAGKGEANLIPAEVHITTERKVRSFTLREHLFVLVAHEYGSWMDLEYFGRIDDAGEIEN